MSRLPWHAWYHSTWLGSEARFEKTLAERGLYRDLLDINYQEGSIPENPEVVRRMVGADPEEFDAAWSNVVKHFEPHPELEGRLVNRKALEVLEKSERYRKAQSENGRKGGRPRKAYGNPSASDQKPVENPRLNFGKAKNRTSTCSIEQVPTGTCESTRAHEGWTGRFDEFYDAFPRKRHRPRARSTYEALVVKGRPPKGCSTDDLKGLESFDSRHARLMGNLPAWAREFADRPADKQPHPASFLNSLDWLWRPDADEPSPNGHSPEYFDGYDVAGGAA